MIRHVNGDLFSAPRGVYLAHACNCMGVWGSGVALQFRKRFPRSFEEYRRRCRAGVEPGDVLVCQEESGHFVVCMFASRDYGSRVDSPQSILAATDAAIKKMPIDRAVHMPRINSGLFRVSWEDTEALLEASKLDITVWTL